MLLYYDRAGIHYANYELQKVRQEGQISEDDMAAKYSGLFALISRYRRRGLGHCV